MSGAAVVKVSFRFVPPDGTRQVEDLSNEKFLEDIRREKTLGFCRLGARPVPEILTSEMEIINDEQLS